MKAVTASTKTCSIVGCDKPSKRTFARDRISTSVIKSGLRLKESRSRRVHLCADHWKTVKKVFKKDTKAERLRWGP